MDKCELLKLADINPLWDQYFISETGEVYSCKSGKPVKLKPVVYNGYRSVSLPVEQSRWKPFKIAFLVCRAFNGPKPEWATLVRHLDGTRDNDIPSNLAWGTAKENSADSIAHGTQSGSLNGKKGALKLIGEQSLHAKLDWESVRIIRQLRHDGETVVPLGEKFNVSAPSISAICKGKTWPEPGAILTKNVTANAKITAEQAAKIRADPRKRSIISAEYGITGNMVWRIKAGRSWHAC